MAAATVLLGHENNRLEKVRDVLRNAKHDPPRFREQLRLRISHMSSL